MTHIYKLMTTITTYIDGLSAIATCLNQADVKGAKALLDKLPKRPTVRTWEVHKLIARAVAKFHTDKMVVADLLDFQYKFYQRYNLNDVTLEIISKHLELTEKGKASAKAKEKARKELEKENQKKQFEGQELNNNGF